MLSLVYVSSALREFSKSELVELLEKSRKKNTRLGLTGMLLYKEGNFIQLPHRGIIPLLGAAD